MTIKIAALIILSFLIGGIPTGYLAVKIVKKRDIRHYGSGNIGFTNVLRTSGLLLGSTVLIIDVAKAFLAAYYLPRVVASPHIYRLIFGIAVILGNIFNPFLRFKGGKGVATGLGVALAMSPLAGIFSIAAFALVVMLARYVSLGSLIGATVFTLSNICFYLRGTSDIYVLCFSVLLTIAVYARHISNIQRLLHGEENKIGKRTNKN